jgi:hypothetical protein
MTRPRITAKDMGTPGLIQGISEAKMLSQRGQRQRKTEGTRVKTLGQYPAQAALHVACNEHGVAAGRLGSARGAGIPRARASGC